MPRFSSLEKHARRSTFPWSVVLPDSSESDSSESREAL